jgi:hypothetical protein
MARKYAAFLRQRKFFYTRRNFFLLANLTERKVPVPGPR